MFSNNVDFLFHFLNRYEYSVVNNLIFVYSLKEAHNISMLIKFKKNTVRELIA